MSARSAWLAAAAIAVVIAVRFAEPIQDGDLFWHMAYARQMLDHGTLRLDHAAFSWMPATTDMIYCAWLSELALFELWERLGPWSVFALRYAVVATVAGLAWAQARRLGVAGSALVPVVVLTLVIGSYASAIVKPELFSLLLLNVLVFVLFRLKREPDERYAKRLPWIIPVLFLAWVNLHGAFIVAWAVLIAAVVGETSNRRLSPALALPGGVYRRLLAATAVAALVLAVNPYGVAYPRQLFADYVLGARPRPDAVWNAAHQSFVSRLGSALHPEELLVLMAVTLIGLGAVRAARAAPGARVDWMIVLANAATIPFFFVWGRTTHLWPAVFAPSALVLLADVRALGARRPAWTATRPLREVAAAVFLYLAAVAVYGAWARPFAQSWLGFGIGYVNPVVEAEWVARHRLGPRLYNVGDAGGYLLWRLGPDVKVMADSRSFPYLSWFDEHYEFIHGRDFEGFTARHPADAAVIDLDKPLLLERFLASPRWRVAFYGPTSAVFVPKERAPSAIDADLASRLDDLRNASTALRVLDLALRLDDRTAGRVVLAQLETRLAHQLRPADRERVRAARARLGS